MNPQISSQSEVDMFLTCKRKHYYAFGEPCKDGSHGIAPITHGESLTRGTIGHAILEDQYNLIQEGAEWVEASRVALKQHFTRMVENREHIKLYNEITDIFAKYIDHYGDDPKDWRILAVEKEFNYQVPETGLTFAFKPDLAIQERSTGNVYIVDHKYLYNDYPARVIPILPQMVKYSYALNQMGYPVKDGIYNRLSTRKNSKEPFKRIPANITNASKKMKRLFHEQVEAMKQIQWIKNNLTTEEWSDRALRSANAYNCKNCPFLELCTADLIEANGRDILLEMSYTPNTYGYGRGIDDESDTA